MSDKSEAGSTETKPTDASTTNGTTADASEMTKEEKSFLMLALWDALIEPKWTKDDLIDFGKAIFTKKKLKDMTDAEFGKVFPFLTNITVELGRKLTKKAEEAISAATPTAPARETGA